MRTDPLARALAVLLAAGLLTAPAAAQTPAASRRREFRVHVSAAGRFVDDLSIKDLALFEEGLPQTITSLTLVRNGAVVRHEGAGQGPIRRARNYTLIFQAVDWDPKLESAIKHLFGSVLRPGDSMTMVTPIKPYYLQKEALAARSSADLSKSMAEVLRKDIVLGGGEYRGLLADLRRLTRAIGAGGGTSSTFDEEMESDSSVESGSFSLDLQIDRYRGTLKKLDGMRLVDESKLLAFADSLRGVPGQKTVVLFYQREYRPEIGASALNSLMSLYQDNPDILANLMDLFEFYKREKTFDGSKVARAFADAGIDFHFVFMEKKSQRVFGATMREQSEDALPGFVAMARGTGGTYENESSPAAAFKTAADVSGDYYLLSFVPAAGPTGAFRSVEVKVDRPGARISAPLGYFAR